MINGWSGFLLSFQFENTHDQQENPFAMSIEDQINLYFRAHKLRKAHKKLLVARYLTTYQDVVAAETLWIRIKEKRLDISIASVYNALNWLVDLGFARKILQGRKYLYQIQDTAVQPDPH